MAAHSSFLAWRIPWTEEPVGLQYIGSQRAYVHMCMCACVCSQSNTYIVFPISELF